MRELMREHVREWEEIVFSRERANVERLRPGLQKIYTDKGEKVDIASLPSPLACSRVVHDTCGTANRSCMLDYYYDFMQSFKRQSHFQNRSLYNNLYDLFFDLTSIWKTRFESLSDHVTPSLLSIDYRLCDAWSLRWSGASSVCVPAFLSFCVKMGFKYDSLFLEKLRQRDEIARNCFCLWNLSNSIILCDRPVSKWDDRNRLHCEDGPAISFDDGYEIYIWHVPKVIMNPQEQTLIDIHSELNAEIRRIRIERLGWQTYLQEAGAVLLNSRRNDVEGTDESLMESPGGRVLVCACPSTGRVYALQVPRQVDTCEQAQNWLSGGLNGRIKTAT